MLLWSSVAVFSLEIYSIISSIFYIYVLLLVHFFLQIAINTDKKMMLQTITIYIFRSTLDTKSVLKMLPKSWISQRIRRKDDFKKRIHQ